MKIAIVGAGFTGLSAAWQLTKKGHQVSIFEKEESAGGLAGTFQPKGWEWPLEKHYHHWFTNDISAINLIKELGLEKHLIFPKTITSIYYQNKSYSFNSPQDVLNFTPLSLLDRIRTGLVTLYLKLLSPKQAIKLEKITAYEWLKKYYGNNAFDVLWKPLLTGKFGPYAQTVNMAWFWARIYKRTPLLGYLEGGYGKLITALVTQIKKEGAKLYLKTSFDPKDLSIYDKVIVTTPSFIFTQMFPQLPDDYKKRLTSIPHLHALNLVLITKEKLLEKDYWLNINDRSYPFIAVVQQTNLIAPKHYGGNHITWVGNYLPPNHPFLKMSKEKIFKLFVPYLNKINPSFNFELCTRPGGTRFELFFGPFAQPVMPINYSKIKPDFPTPIPNVYLANMDMVYPWDRGTNYAIELGEKVAEIIERLATSG